MRIARGNRVACQVAIAACIAVLAPSALAQQPYPNRAVRLILPLAPGGTTDIMARTVSPHLSAGLGQPVIVENRTGAGGVVGADFVAKAQPDGYTLLLVSADTYTTNAVTYPKLPFDARKDLKPVSILAAGPSVLTVHPSLPVKTVKDLVALSKARPKDLNYGSGGTSGQLLVELVKVMQVPEVGTRLSGEGAEVIANTPGEAAAIVNRSLDKWADVVRRTGIKLE